MSRSRPQSAGEFLSQEARLAVRDIRQRLFEEAWFGRVVTGQPRVHEQEKSLAALWGRESHAPETQQADRDLER